MSSQRWIGRRCGQYSFVNEATQNHITTVNTQLLVYLLAVVMTELDKEFPGVYATQQRILAALSMPREFPDITKETMRMGATRFAEVLNTELVKLGINNNIASLKDFVKCTPEEAAELDKFIALHSQLETVTDILTGENELPKKFDLSHNPENN